MVGLYELLPALEHRIFGSLLIGLVAFVLTFVVRRARRRVASFLRPIGADLVSSTAYIAIVLGTTLLIADIWGQTDILLEQLGFLRLDARAPQFVITIVVLVAIQVFVGIAARLLEDLTTDSQALTEHQREVGLRMTQLSLWTVGAIVILGVWDVDLTGLLVGAGFLGIVIGLASRKTIGSLLAGIVLMFSQPFEVGDWVVVGDHEGIVSDITLMSTRIQAFDGEHVVVPNDVVSNETVVNRSRRGKLRVEVEVGVDYDAEIDHARDVARQTAHELADGTSEILDSPAPDVLVRRLGDSAIVLAVRVWVNQPTSGEVNRIRGALLSDLKEAFEAEDIAIPYPQRQLSSRADGTGAHVAGKPREGDARPMDRDPAAPPRDDRTEDSVR